MLALTIWQPWAAAIALGVKLVENRDWRPPVTAMRQRIAIHAAKKEPDLDDVAEVEEIAGRQFDYFLGSILAVATLTKVVSFARDLPEEQRRWFVGEYGWVLSDVRPIKRIACRGMQGLWALPPDVEQQVLCALAEAPK